jgi:hypothetical protein
MTVTKTVMGSCFFEYITEHDSVEKALNNEGIFKEVKVNKVRVERTLTKENDEQRHQNSDKVEG